MSQHEKFLNFLQQLEIPPDLLESVKNGYKTIYETYNIYVNTGAPKTAQGTADMITEEAEKAELCSCGKPHKKKHKHPK